MKVLSVVGARPQIVQTAPIAWQLTRRGDERLIVHTGRHSDHLLAKTSFTELGVPPSDGNLQAGLASQAEQTSRMLTALDPVLARERPDWLPTHGDTDSTLAGTLPAAARELPIAHLGPGLRSFDRTMSEERNRTMADHLAGLLLALATVATADLAAEGLTARSPLAGDLTVDTLRVIRDQWAGPGEERHSPSRTGHPFTTPDRVSRVLPVRHRASAGHHRRSGSAGRDGRRARRLPQVRPAADTPTAHCRSRQFDIDLPGGSLRAGRPTGRVQHTARRDRGRRLFRTAGTSWCPIPEGCQRPGRGRPGEPPTPFGDGEAAVRINDVLASRAHDERTAQHAARCARAASAEVRT
ncbi:UDP-N-acetylglucosamine 2-epimerase [Streptomyces sp. NPDC094143]|uniref:UDP-N-acetylglucosamine 2-epimerase n=1 Tax=Streptomyces sp. NPDC094143 TaxID=3155310 RepID=UPI00331D583A